MPVLNKDRARTLTLEEIKALSYGSYVYLPCGNPLNKRFGQLLRVKINGAPKTWKRQPDKVRVPYKYGIYEYGYITEHDKVYVKENPEMFNDDYV